MSSHATVRNLPLTFASEARHLIVNGRQRPRQYIDQQVINAKEPIVIEDVVDVRHHDQIVIVNELSEQRLQPAVVDDHRHIDEYQQLTHCSGRGLEPCCRLTVTCVGPIDLHLHHPEYIHNNIFTTQPK